MYEKVRVTKDGFRDEKRVIIIDFQHIAFKYLFGSKSLSKRLDIGNGLTETIDTTIPNYAIKDIMRLGKYGLNYVCVCMDSTLESRKQAFYEETKSDKNMTVSEYKGTRAKTVGRLMDGIRLTTQLLEKSGITVFKKYNYEADDLVFCAMQRAKKEFPTLPIDIITNDWDYAPMADEQVSVYIRSKKRTSATTGVKRLKYVQVTPDTYAELAGETTAYKNKYVPYNTILLWKILRGDKSDNIEPMKNEKGRNKWTPLKMKKLIEQLQDSNILTNSLFAYKDTPTKIVHKTTGEVVDEISFFKELKKGNLDVKEYKMSIGDPKGYKDMCDRLQLAISKGYIDEDDYNFILKRFNIMNLNGAFLNTITRRRPAVMTQPFTKIDSMRVSKAVSYLDIHVPLI